MPSKIQLDENLWFLFICLQKSDYKTIDFNAVGQATNLKSPAARMRYTRLRRQIEGGTLIGTHGTPFAEKMPSDMRKRTRVPQPEVSDGKQPRVFAKTFSPDRKIKSEPRTFSERYESDSPEDEDSEDEIPLAKRRQDRVKSGPATFEISSVAISHPDFSSGLHNGQENRPLKPNIQLDVSHSHLPETHEDCRNILQNSKPNPHSLTTKMPFFDFTAQPLDVHETKTVAKSGTAVTSPIL